MSSALYGKLAPSLCALPKVGTTINVNTASPLLMHAPTPNPGPELDQFLEERLKKPAENISELFNSRKVFGADAASTSLMGTSSEFFELRAEAYIGSGRVELYSFYYRPGSQQPLVYGRSTSTA